MDVNQHLSPPSEDGYEAWSGPYHIYEGDSGLQISESRVLLFDVMQYYDEGKSIYQLCEIFNLTPLQVKTAIAYIDKHRATLEPKLAKAIAYRKERKAYHRRLVAEHLAKVPPLPMTPLRAAVYALLEKHRLPDDGDPDADCGSLNFQREKEIERVRDSLKQQSPTLSIFFSLRQHPLPIPMLRIPGIKT